MEGNQKKVIVEFERRGAQRTCKYGDCNTKHKHQKAFEAHIREHIGGFKCAHCHKKFTHWVSMKGHCIANNGYFDFLQAKV